MACAGPEILLPASPPSLAEIVTGDDLVECPLCRRPRPVGAFALAGPLVEMRGADGVVKHGRARTKRAPKPEVRYVTYDPNDPSDAGQLQPIAARVLMKIVRCPHVSLRPPSRRMCPRPACDQVGRHL